MNTSRLVSWFSCGAASAVATKLAIAENKALGLPFVIVYTEVVEEHPDNKRFLADCEKWFGQEIIILRNDKYSASINEVFRKERFLVGPKGAACTRLLKKETRKAFQQTGDRQVFGYTADEVDRVDLFIDSNNDVDLWPILVEKGLTKGDCLAVLSNAGIALPAMYLLGYKNNNCIGCVKGGAGYWNKIRVDFPLVFLQRSRTERILNRTICKVGKERVFLDELPEGVGHYPTEQSIQCGIFCELAEMDIAA
jgi:hypothetical protein